jgi:hypothetical protein
MSRYPACIDGEARRRKMTRTTYIKWSSANRSDRRIAGIRAGGRNVKTVVIVGALDTKGREFAFVKDLIEQQGARRPGR